jgi:hypothetical protein
MEAANTVSTSRVWSFWEAAIRPGRTRRVRMTKRKVLRRKRRR